MKPRSLPHLQLVHRDWWHEARERMDPKRVKLRAYLSREILQPAERRHERGL
jgi:hypothetical protein